MGKISEQYFGKPLGDIETPDIQVLIDEKTIEDSSLDYTEIPKSVSYDELAKNISAFLNTNGGLVIFGVREQKKKYPKEITWGNASAGKGNRTPLISPKGALPVRYPSICAFARNHNIVFHAN